MNGNVYFDSFTKPIPPMRRDVQPVPVRSNGSFYLYFYDALKYSNPGFALNREVEPILSLINGQLSVEQIEEMTGGEIKKEDLLNFVKMLDEELLLESEFYKKHVKSVEENFERQSVREPALSGTSYPEGKDEISSYLEKIFKSVVKPDYLPQKALLAPHIDTDIGAESYARAFSSLREIKPERVVILATSHYAGYFPKLYDNKPFIGTRKTYLSPAGNNKADLDYMDRLLENSEFTGYTENDRAHRTEHSIELHLLFANYIWQHDFRIVPILIGGFDELYYKKDGALGSHLGQFSKQLADLDTPGTFYLISGDLSHVGMKFGDNRPAANMKNRVRMFDKAFIELASQNLRNELFEHISSDYDPFRVCGFPPLYTFLNTFPDLKGSIIDYQWWDEAERHSAVSYGVIGY